MKIFFIIHVMILISVSANNEEVDKTFKLLKEGDKKIELNDRHKNVTLVLGNTGSGKSTFIQWFAGDNTKLIATEVTKDSGDFIIVDNNRINDGVDSKTIFPELVVKNETNEAFYDCPGFSDTRSSSNDIANTYFIKTLTDFADNIRILFIINYSSLKKGEDRLDFMRLMKHATELVKDVNKYESSIAIVASKVVDFRIIRGVPELVPDEIIVEKIADFIKQVHANLIEKRTDSKITEQDKKMNENVIKVLDILLTKNSSKIGIFRRPLESGPLSENAIMQKGKSRIEQIMSELKFTEKSNNDFGYTVSDKSLNYINVMTNKISHEIDNNLNEIVLQLSKYYENSSRQVLDQIVEFDNSQTLIDHVVVQFNAIMSGDEIMSNLMKNLNNITDIEKVTREVELALEKMEIKFCDDNIKHLKEQGKYLNFFESVSNMKFATKSYKKTFEPVETFLKNSKKSIEDSIENSVKKSKKDLGEIFKNIMSEIEKNFQQKSEKVSIDESISSLHHSQGVLSQLLDNLIKNQTLELSNTIHRLDINSLKVKKKIAKISSLHQFVSFLNDLKPFESSSWSSEWISSIKQTLEYFTQSESWFKFLKSLYEKYSTYEVQKSSSESKKFPVTTSSFKKFIKDLKDLKIDSYNENIEPNEQRLKTLNQVLSSTLGGVDNSCSESGEMVVKGDFIKINDFTSKNGSLQHNCKVDLKSLKVFAMNTFFVDRHLNLVGSKLQVSIVAPKWWIVDNYIINLDGEDNNHIYTQKAEDGKDRGHNGLNGKPGLPGGNAGNFLGIGKEIINTQFLTVSANGGRGSSGQDGGNGAEGREGAKASTYIEEDRRGCYDSERKVAHVEWKCKRNGETGGAAGDAGAAGAGGLGGLSGNIKFITIDKTSENPKLFMKQGLNGNDGTPGRKGRQGKHGKDFYYFWCEAFPFKMFCPENRGELRESNKEREDPGTLGGISKSGIEQPKAPVDVQNIALFSNEYKKLIRDHFNNIFNSKFIAKFFIDLNDKLEKFTNALSLVNDLSTLVRQENHLNSMLDRETVIYFYETILNQTSEYSKNPQSNEKSLEYRKVLGFLYTAVVSRLFNLKEKTDGNLIVDLDKYLDMVIDEVYDLRNLQEKNVKSQVIQTHNEKYKSDFDGKIEEAGKFINEQIHPEIEKIKVQLDRNIEALIDETLKLQEKGKEEEDKLKKVRDKLKTAIVTSKVFSVLGTSAQILGCFTGVGVPLAAAIGTISKVTDSLILNGTEKETEIFKLPESVTKDLNSIIHVTEASFKISKNIERIDEYSKAGMEIAKKYKEDDKKMKEINNAISKAEENYKNLQKYENSIYETMIPSMKNMQRDIDNFSKNLDGKSQVSLDVTKWQVKTALTDMRSGMRKFTKNFKVDDELARNIEKIEEAMTTLIDIYNRVENYQNQKILADYLANIVSAGSSAIVISDTKLSNAVDDLELMIRTNIILNRYEEVFNAMKQQVFPLAQIYLPQETLPSNLMLDETLENLTRDAMVKIDKIRTQLVKYKSSITNIDEYLSRGQFTSDGVSTKPFHIWKNDKNKNLITDLLSGKKIAVKPNISSLKTKDAVKFNKIDINFKSSNQTVTQELRQKLNGFKVSLAHMGNSYYRFNNNIYVIASKYQNIMYNFERDDKGRPVHNNAVYDKLKDGNLMLSPYAMWEIQLFNLTNKITFDDLKIYRDLVDLEMVGYGAYIEQGSKVFNFDVSTYYEAQDDV